MKVLLVSEGAHELNPDGDSSALCEIVQRLLPSITQLDRRLIRDKIVQQTAVRGKKKPHQVRLMMWIRWAEKSGYDAIIAVIDEDGYAERRTAVDDLQKSTFSTLPRALGLAIRMFDAWMLTDEMALTNVIGKQVSRQKAPESIKQPKKVLAELLESSETTLSRPLVYSEIARCCDLEKLAQRCSKGFAPFRKCVEQLRIEPT